MQADGDDVGLLGQTGHRAGNAGVAVTASLANALQDAQGQRCARYRYGVQPDAAEVPRAAHHRPQAGHRPRPAPAGEPSPGWAQPSRPGVDIIGLGLVPNGSPFSGTQIFGRKIPEGPITHGAVPSLDVARGPLVTPGMIW